MTKCLRLLATLLLAISATSLALPQSNNGLNNNGVHDASAVISPRQDGNKSELASENGVRNATVLVNRQENDTPNIASKNGAYRDSMPIEARKSREVGSEDGVRDSTVIVHPQPRYNPLTVQGVPSSVPKLARQIHNADYGSGAGPSNPPAAEPQPTTTQNDSPPQHTQNVKSDAAGNSKRNGPLGSEHDVDYSKVPAL